MKNTVILFFIFSALLTFTNGKAQERYSQNDNGPDNLDSYSTCKEDSFRGKVKQVHQDSYKASGGQGQTSPGERTALDNFVITYDSSGNKTSVELDLYTETVSGDKMVCNRVTYQYNAKARKFSNKDEFILYDARWNRIEEENLNNLQYTSKETYRYDKNGKMLEQKQYTSGTLKGINNFTYDSTGNIIEKAEYGGFNDFKSPRIETCKYNKKRECIEDDVTFPTTYTPTDKDPAKFIYRYNKIGDIILTEGYSTNGKLLFTDKYDYAYDKHSNWTRKIVFLKKAGEAAYQPLRIVTRTINYY